MKTEIWIGIIILFILGAFNTYRLLKDPELTDDDLFKKPAFVSFLYVICPIIILLLMELQFSSKKEIWPFIFLAFFFSIAETILSFLKTDWRNKLRAINSLIFIIVFLFSLSYTYVEREKENKKILAHELSIEDIKNSFSKLNDNIDGFENSMRNETLKIDEKFSILISQIEEKQKELIILEEKQNNFIKQIETYKNISSLNEEQALAVLNQLKETQSSSYIDYIIGFGLGLIASIIANFINLKGFRLKKIL